MREVHVAQIVETVARLCQEANYELGEAELAAFRTAADREQSTLGKRVLLQILENAQIARDQRLPLCQDTGFTVVFLEVGQDLRIVGGYLYDAINEGVRRGYTEGYLRKSMVDKPLTVRKNTGDNTPAIIHAEIVPGDRLKIVVAPKGAGSENVTRLGMLKPADGLTGFKRFVFSAVKEAGPNACPPFIVGVGVGGTSEKAVQLAKKAIVRPLGQKNPDPEIAALEEELLELVNKSGVGPLGFGGIVTAIAVHIETYPTHIASLPVAVNLQCHSARHKEAVL